MAVLTKEQVTHFEAPREIVNVPELGGDVVVVSMGWEQKTRLGSTPGKVNCGEILAATILDANDEPIKTVDEWNEWGGVFTVAGYNLVNTVFRLSDTEEEAKKK